jgi:GAF domain-containing protein
MRELLAGEGFTQALVVPLVAEHGPVGTLLGLGRATAAIRASPGVLGAIARDLGAAVDNAQARRRLEGANGDLLRLLTLVKILAEPRSLEDTLTTVAQAARSFTRAMTVAVWLANPETRRLHQIVAIGPSGRWRREQPRILPYGQDVAGWIAEHGEPAHLDDALSDARLGDPAWARERGIASVYGFPLRFLDRLVGVLSVGTEKPLTGPRASLLEAYSDHAALAIGQADLRRQLEAR